MRGSREVKKESKGRQTTTMPVVAGAEFVGIRQKETLHHLSPS
jgi:hypothetical protein